MANIGTYATSRSQLLPGRSSLPASWPDLVRRGQLAGQILAKWPDRPRPDTAGTHEGDCAIHCYSILYSSRSNLGTIRTGMWPVSASASGFAGDEGTPRNGGRGGRADGGRGGRPAAGGNPGPGGHRAGDLSQEEFLDLVVEAMAQRTTTWATTTTATAASPAASGARGTGTTGTRRARRAPAGSTAAPRDSVPGSPLMWRGRGPCWRGRRIVCIPAGCGWSVTMS